MWLKSSELSLLSICQMDNETENDDENMTMGKNQVTQR